MGILLAMGSPSNAFARTDVSIGLQIGDRYRGPEIYFRSAPRVVVVPNTQVYYVQDYEYDMYRYGRFWYMNYDGAWYRSRHYRGPWVFVGYRSVPTQISYVPQRYRRHWREFRDDTRYGSSPRGRGWGNRNRNWDPRDRNRDGRVDWRDRNQGDQDRNRYDARDRNRDGQIDSRDQNQRDRNPNQRDQDPRDRNRDGRDDWRDR